MIFRSLECPQARCRGELGGRLPGLAVNASRRMMSHSLRFSRPSTSRPSGWLVEYSRIPDFFTASAFSFSTSLEMAWGTCVAFLVFSLLTYSTIDFASAFSASMVVRPRAACTMRSRSSSESLPIFTLAPS